MLAFHGQVALEPALILPDPLRRSVRHIHPVLSVTKRSYQPAVLGLGLP
jgi:hypothetical protein